MKNHEHGECQWCAGYETAVRDLMERMETAAAELDGLFKRSAENDLLVYGKALGVRLALSYAWEAIQP